MSLIVVSISACQSLFIIMYFNLGMKKLVGNIKE